MESSFNPSPRAAASIFPGIFSSSVGVEPEDRHGGVRGGDRDGSGGSNSNSNNGGGRDRGGVGGDHGNRYKCPSAASPCVGSSPSSFKKVSEGHSGVPGGGIGSSSRITDNTGGSGSGRSVDHDSRNNRYDGWDDSQHNRPGMHRPHNPETIDVSQTAMHSLGEVALSAPRGAFAWSSSMPSDSEGQQKEGEVVKEEEDERGEEHFVSSMLTDSRELEGDMLLPEGWLRYPPSADEDENDTSDEMVYRFLVEDHFGML